MDKFLIHKLLQEQSFLYAFNHMFVVLFVLLFCVLFKFI
jgi:hypothetical protein